MFLQLTNQSWDRNCLIMLFFNFDLMKNAAIRRSNQLLGILTSWKVPKNSISWKIEFWSHEKLNFDLMKNWILISWNSTSWPWVNKICQFVNHPLKSQRQLNIMIGKTEKSNKNFLQTLKCSSFCASIVACSIKLPSFGWFAAVNQILREH